MNKNKVTQKDWYGEMVESYKFQINTGLKIYDDLDKAIEYANKNSCAGWKVKEEVLATFNRGE